jgi:hypothetical protein
MCVCVCVCDSSCSFLDVDGPGVEQRLDLAGTITRIVQIALSVRSMFAEIVVALHADERQ